MEGSRRGKGKAGGWGRRKDEEKQEKDEETEELKRFTMQGNGKGICFI